MAGIDFVILGVLCAVIACAVRYIIKRRKQGKGGCQSCSHKGSCESKFCK